MHQDRTSMRDRLDRVVRDRIEPAVHRDAQPLRVERWDVPGEPVPVADALRADYAPCSVGDPWGAPWGTTWFRLTGTVPRAWPQDRAQDPPQGRAQDRAQDRPPGAAAAAPVEAVIDLGFSGAAPGFQAEGLAYTLDGRPLKGIAPRSGYVPLAAGPGERVGLLVEAAANPDVAGGWDFRPTRLGDRATAGSDPLYRLARADLAVLDTPVWELLQDVRALRGLATELDARDPRAAQVVRALDRMVDVLDPEDVSGTASAAREVLAGVLASPASASSHLAYAVGHSHIDSAWLWPTRETVRKAARTLSSVATLMDADPGFVFAVSQAQQLAWVEEQHPEVYRRVRDKVAAGQIVPVGGMWVEADSTMPGGEAMARQFLLGKAFLQREFGVEPQEVWLPDSFGYSAAMPQIARLAGCRWFLTQKMSWNRTNAMPHHSFWWEGIDGSRVFTHFPPVDTYNSDLSGAELAHASRNFADAGPATMSLVPFGYGDGGGGPTREMLAAARRSADLEGSPRVRLASPREFFEAAEAEYADAPVWSGEMYLEAHRGTLTSQARTKQGNRRSEHLLREAELWSAHAAVAGLLPYPYDELDAIWKVVLLNQFHDILPGSAIAWVHREAEAAYARVAEQLEAIVGAAQQALAGRGSVPVTFNAGPFARAGAPGLGAGATTGAATDTGDPVAVRADGDGHVLDNGVLRVVVDGRGLVTSVLDLAADRELVPAGACANLLQLHRDVPNRWDAWDLDEHYRHVRTDLDRVESLEQVAGGVRVTRAFGRSRVVQVITLPPAAAGLPGPADPEARRVDFVTEVDWQERDKVLKVAFALDVHADRFASETQFGHVYRPTHTNTSWDAARYEVAAHRWVHVGEPGYGVAVANDRTYGHDVSRAVAAGGAPYTVVRLSLLRAPQFPDPDTDRGSHRFAYALVPGGTVDAVAASYDLNLPMRTVQGASAVEPLLTVDSPAVVVEAVKLAQDRSGDVVVRLYEALGTRARARVAPSVKQVKLAGVEETDLLERPMAGSALRGWSAGEVAVELRPFQIVTLRLRVRRG